MAVRHAKDRTWIRSSCRNRVPFYAVMRMGAMLCCVLWRASGAQYRPCQEVQRGEASRCIWGVSFVVHACILLHACRDRWLRVALKSFLAAAARGRDLGRAHEVADVLLQKLVVAVQLVVLLAHRLNPVEDGDERLLQRLGVSALGC